MHGGKRGNLPEKVGKEKEFTRKKRKRVLLKTKREGREENFLEI